jgi:hypothetical protein
MQRERLPVTKNGRWVIGNLVDFIRECDNKTVIVVWVT